MNLGLGLFNLIPIPPLDGSRILGAILPNETYRKYMSYEKYGFFILLGLMILSDILGGNNYIVELNGVISATFAAFFDGEPTYNEIKGKGWLNDRPYAVVHRIAVSDIHRRKGIAKDILHFAEEACTERGVSDIPIDTHCDNRAMRSLLKKMGYTHCGRITLTSGAAREAYQKELKN